MIAFLNGVVAGSTADTLYLDVNGVGYAIGMPAFDLAKLSTGDSAMVLTHMAVREDAIALYGFLSQDEKSLFERLIGVSGVGPKVALSALSSFRPEELINAIANQDDKAIASVSGIGKKTAQRIILELKGSFTEAGSMNLFNAQTAAAAERLAGAREALLAMGFSSAEADLALKGAPEDKNTESALLQYALRRLGA